MVGMGLHSSKSVSLRLPSYSEPFSGMHVRMNMHSTSHVLVNLVAGQSCQGHVGNLLPC